MLVAFKCVQLIRNFTGSCILKVASLCIICIFQNNIFPEKKSIFAIKITIKKVPLFSVNEKDRSAFSAVKKIIIKFGCCIQQRLLVKRKREGAYQYNQTCLLRSPANPFFSHKYHETSLRQKLLKNRISAKAGKVTLQWLLV